ncbi:uncharacterized protein [Nicotiana tomentosiformis]|uniref:uncharacterized protein n=1 Tax=Nicotiana tomentosiformis TaxID=4098 RepID=UPI00388CB685
MGLADSLKANVDASAGGEFLSKSFRECKILLDKMAQNSGWMTRDSTNTPIIHSVALDPNNSIAENMATLMTQMSILTKKIDESGQKHNYKENMNYVANYGGQRQGGQNWGQQNQQYRLAQQQYNNSNNPGAMRPQGQVVLYQMDEKAQQMQEKVVSQDSTIKGIEVQLGQISMALNNHLEQEIARESRTNETLVPVPIEIDNSTSLTEVTIQHAQESKSKEKEVAKETEVVQEMTVEAVLEQDQTQITGRKRPPTPFPHRLAKYRKDEQYKKFMEMLKQIQVNIPLIDALREMPGYAKMMKD